MGQSAKLGNLAKCWCRYSMVYFDLSACRDGLYWCQCHSLFQRFGRLDWFGNSRTTDTTTASRILEKAFEDSLIYSHDLAPRWKLGKSRTDLLFHCLHGGRNLWISLLNTRRLVQSWTSLFMSLKMIIILVACMFRIKSYFTISSIKMKVRVC